jgi:homoserine O-acetyltransferase
VLALPAIHSTHHRLDFLIGPGRALDTSRWCVICVDAIGNGLTTSPSTSARQPLLEFPFFSIRDMVRSQHALVRDHLGIERLACIVGASMGGMQVLQWGVTYPRAAACLVAMTPMAKTAAWSVAVNEAYRQSLMRDADWWQRGPRDTDWRAWVGVQLLAGRTPASIAAQFADGAMLKRWIDERAQWQSAQGSHPVDRVYQTRAYDAHDIGREDGFAGDTAAALASIPRPTLVFAPPLDLYNPQDDAAAVARGIPGARLAVVPTDAGHQCTTTLRAEDAAFVSRQMADFLEAHAAD